MEDSTHGATLEQRVTPGTKISHFMVVAMGQVARVQHDTQFVFAAALTSSPHLAALQSETEMCFVASSILREITASECTCLPHVIPLELTAAMKLRAMSSARASRRWAQTHFEISLVFIARLLAYMLLNTYFQGFACCHARMWPPSSK